MLVCYHDLDKKSNHISSRKKKQPTCAGTQMKIQEHLITINQINTREYKNSSPDVFVALNVYLVEHGVFWFACNIRLHLHGHVTRQH